MCLHTHRSTDLHILADLLAAHLDAAWPDPFEAVPIVVGSRGMARWVRHELATRLASGVVARVVFPMLGPALDRATLQLVDPDALGVRAWWEPDVASPWRPSVMQARLVPLLRARRDHPAFATVAKYLGYANMGPRAPIPYRELAFARQVAEVLDRLMRDRSADALTWAGAPNEQGRHAWLATLLADLGGAETDAPPRRFAALVEARPATLTFRMFGPSFLTPGERARLEALGRAADVHVYAWSPWLAGRSDGHPIARSFGRPLCSLDALPAQEWHPVECVAGASLLARLQSEVRGVPCPAAPLDPADDTLTFHAAHSPLREVEVLRDTLLAWFAEDSTLEPRDVLVMTPALGTYAPLVAAVFAQTVDGVPRIPVSIADLGLRQTNPVAAVFLAVLALIEDRITGPALADLFALAPVATRFGLDAEDLVALRGLIARAEMGWGLDAADRARTGLPARGERTLLAGVERFALGALLPAEDPFAVVEGAEPAVAPVPLEVDTLRLAGALASAVRALVSLRDRLADAAMPMAGWRAALGEILDAFVEVEQEQGWLRAEAVEALDTFTDAVAPLGDLPLEASAIRRFLRGRFEVSEGGDRPITGAVTMSDLLPMRGVPYRRVALLGMGDGAFPRGKATRAWDPFDAPREDELDARAIDRGLLLEAFQCATERFYVSWCGFDPPTGERVGAAVPVEELLEEAAAACGTTRADLVREHALQPWTPDRFATTFDNSMVAASEALAAPGRVRVGLPACRDDVLPPEEAPHEISLSALAKALSQPQRELLNGRLRIWLEDGSREPSERAPVANDALVQWAWRNRALRALEAGGRVTADAIARRLAAEGRPPVGGDEPVAAALEEAEYLAAALRSVAGRRVDPPLVVAVMEGVTLYGRAPAAREHDGALLLEWVHAGSPKPAHRLEAWVHLLAARVADVGVVGARVVGRGAEGVAGMAAGELLACPPSREDARAQLADLLAVRALVRRRAAPLFEKVSPALVEHLGTDRLRSKVGVAWAGSWGRDDGEQQNAWVAALFPDYDPCAFLDDECRDGLVDLARRVWSPVLAAAGGGGALACAWAPEGA